MPQVAAAAQGGAAVETAELRFQIEAHSRLSATWGVKAAKLLERILGLQHRSSPSAPFDIFRCALIHLFPSLNHSITSRN